MCATAPPVIDPAHQPNQVIQGAAQLFHFQVGFGTFYQNKNWGWDDISHPLKLAGFGQLHPIYSSHQPECSAITP